MTEIGILLIIVHKSHCVKSVGIRSYLVRIFPHSDWIRRGTPYISVFSSNAGKYEPEYLRIWTLSIHCQNPLTLLLFVSYWANHNADLPSSNNVSKTLRISGTGTMVLSKEYLIRFLMLPRVLDFVLEFSSYWCVKFMEILEFQKLNFSISLGLKGLTFRVYWNVIHT